MGGAAGGTVFLKSAFLIFLVIFLQTVAEIDARNLPKNFLTPSAVGRVNGGQQGGQFS